MSLMSCQLQAGRLLHCRLCDMTRSAIYWPMQHTRTHTQTAVAVFQPPRRSKQRHLLVLCCKYTHIQQSCLHGRRRRALCERLSCVVALVRLGTAQQYWMEASELGRCFLDYALTFGSRVVSVLGSGAVGPGFKSQPRRCRVTVLGKLFTPIAPLFTKQQNR